MPRNDTLRAYKPTIREEGANLFARYTGNDYAAQDRARNLFGVGRMGAMDFTPLGTAFALEEAGRTMVGNPWLGAGEAALAVVPIPAAGKAFGKGLKKAAGGVAKPKAITAYHGSPHTFDAFDTSKIGTGEGAQAYGHGLYFAENEGVAKDYRRVLTGNHAGDQFTPSVDGQRAEWTPALRAIAQRKQSPESFIASMQPNLQRAQAEVAKASDDFERMVAQSQLQEVQALVDEARGYVGKKVDLMPPGSMYQVRINADPNRFANWDAPMSEQHPKVQQALGWTPGQQDVLAGEKLRRGYGNEMFGGDLIGADRATPDQVSQGLASKGVPGIKYLDQGSRGAGDGSRNYVVFNAQIVEIMKRYGVAAPVAAAILSGQMQPPEPQR